MELFFNDMVEEIALEVYFELHRAVKLGYFEHCYPEENAFESHAIVQDKSLDIFGNSAQDVKKFVECPCPKCSRILGTSKFAPHLEKCLGMGRNSSRIANKKSSPIIDSDDEDDENEGEEWIFPAEKKINNKSKPKKDTKLLERPTSNSPKLLVKGSRSTERSISPAVSETSSTRPIGVVYTVEYFKSLSNDQKRSALQEMCGVISERTKRLCTRSVNCPQHTEEQKRRLRMTIMDSSNDTESPHPSKKLKLESSSSHLRSHDESESTGLSVESGDKQRSRSPHHSGQSALSSSGKSKKSSSKKSKSHHDLSSSSSTSKKSKLKNKQANKQPVAVKTYTDMPIF